MIIAADCLHSAVMFEINQVQLIAFSAIILSVFLNWLIKFANRCKNLPPGPWGLPVVGYVPWLGKKPYESFVKIAKKYGSVFSVNLGSETVVVLNDWESIKESLINQSKVFSGRSYSFVYYSLTKGKDIGSNNGPVWKKQRNTTLHILRNLGIGKKSMESRVTDLAHEVMDALNQADGKVQSMEFVFFGSILKTNWKLVSGNDEGHSVDLKEMKKIFTVVFKALSMDNPVTAFPWLRFFPPNGFGYWESVRKNETFLSFLRKVVDDHVVEWKEGKLDDFVDCYLAEINKHKAETGNEDDPLNSDYLVYTLYDLFMAGVDTTNSTCLWGFLHLALNPSIQKKVQDELDEVVGRHREPNMSDMPLLPYLEALVMEVHRMASLAPLAIPHSTTEDTSIFGYNIPKGTTFIQNIYAVHYDPKLWSEPQVFKPERFLNEKNKVKAPPYFMPFSIGPRICPGQSLAEMELRLVFSCLLHHFTFSLPQDRPLPTLESKMGLTINPHPYALLISKRT